MFAWVGAGEAVSLSDLPHQLGLALGTTDFIGQLIATAIFVMLFIVPVLYFTRGRNPTLVLAIAFLVMAICTALAWLPLWVMIMTCVVAALMFSGTARNWLSGHGGGN